MLPEETQGAADHQLISLTSLQLLYPARGSRQQGLMQNTVDRTVAGCSPVILTELHCSQQLQSLHPSHYERASG